jgi:Flp pilus assembly protein TadB
MSRVLFVVAASLAVVLLAARWHRRITMPSRRPVTVVVGDHPPPLTRWLRRRPRPPTDSDVAAWCERVSAGLRSGRSLAAAVIEADATTDGGSRPFADVVHAVHRGRSLGDAFRAVDTDPSTPTGLAAPVLATCADFGGASAAPIDAVADVLIARASERAERLSASAQARLSARVLTTVPFGVAGLLIVAEPSVRHVLTSPIGAACLLGGALLNLAGWWWMRTLIRSAS